MPDEPKEQPQEPQQPDFSKPAPSIWETFERGKIGEARDIAGEVQKEMSTPEGDEKYEAFVPEVLINGFKNIFKNAKKEVEMNEGEFSYPIRGKVAFFEDEDLRIVMRPYRYGSDWDENVYNEEPTELEISLTSPRDTLDPKKMRRVEVCGKIFPEYFKLNNDLVRSHGTFILDFENMTYEGLNSLDVLDDDDKKWYLKNKIFNEEDLESFSTEDYLKFTDNNPVLAALLDADDRFVNDQYRKPSPEDLEQLQTIFVKIRSGLMTQPTSHSSNS